MSKILVIDDQPGTLELMSRLFKAEGYAVDAVDDGVKAREYLERVDYDVVFTDLRLGYPYDGLEMLELIKKIRPRTQVVIMTAFSSVESSVLAMKAGAYDRCAMARRIYRTVGALDTIIPVATELGVGDLVDRALDAAGHP